MWSSRWFLSTPGIQVVTQHVPRLPHWSSVRLPFVRRLLRTFGSSSSDDRDHPDHARAEGQRRAKMTGPVPDVIVVGRRNKNKATPTAEELDSLLKEYASAREKKIEDKVLHLYRATAQPAAAASSGESEAVADATLFTGPPPENKTTTEDANTDANEINGANLRDQPEILVFTSNGSEISEGTAGWASMQNADLKLIRKITSDGVTKEGKHDL